MLAAALAFPAGTPDALQYAGQCYREGRIVVSAASVAAQTTGYDHREQRPSESGVWGEGND